MKFHLSLSVDCIIQKDEQAKVSKGVVVADGFDSWMRTWSSGLNP